jgi:hypothetical protein
MKFEIIYQLKGTRKVIAEVPDSYELPLSWGDMSEADRDEWIYNRQNRGEIVIEDIHHAQADSVEWAQDE